MSQDTTSRPERLAVLARVVEARAAAVQRTIEQVDDMAAIQSGAFDVVGERVNLVPLIARVVAGVRSLSTQHRFHVGAPQGLTAVGDPRRIEQVVQILIDQAVRRNPRGCWIDVDLRRPLTGLAQIEIRDYGRRLTPAERDRLPGQPSPARQWYLCKHIVERHSGTLSVEFPDERGMRASVTLPTNGGRLSGS
jgi:signal transduction histidine kinase